MFWPAWKACVDQQEEPYLLSGGAQLLCHFERHHSSKAHTTQMIWTFRLDRAYLSQVVRGHVLDARVRRFPSV